MKKTLFYLLFILLIIISSVTVFADDSKVTFINRDSGFAFSPGSELSSTDLFPNFKNLMPGDSCTQKITVKNYGDGEFKSKIYMRALGAHEDSEEFLSNLKLTVAVRGDDAYLFDSSANETAGLTDWTLLGTLYAGNSIDLDVTLDVPTSLDTKFENAVGYLDWEFMVEEHLITDPTTPTPDTPPAPQKIDIPVKIVWIDNDNAYGKRPEKVDIELITGSFTIESAVVSASDSWEYTFTGVTANKTYSVTEQSVDGYTTTYSGNAKDGFVITNVYVKPVEPPVSEKKDVNVLVVWMDDNNSEGKRPEKVTITFTLEDGSETLVELSDDNEWKHTFKDIDVNMSYTITQNDVDGYKTEYAQPSENTVVITNTLIKTEEPDEPTPDEPIPDVPTPPTGDTSLTPTWTKIAVISFCVMAILIIILFKTRKKNPKS